MHTLPPSSRHYTRGSTLLEVLVSIVVLSIGLLGLAGLQATSMKSNHSAYMRSQATLLAYDLADRMRATRDSSTTPLPGSGRYDDASTDPDRANWDASVVGLLGAGATGTVTRTDGHNVTITITWDDTRGEIRGNAAPPASPPFVYQTEI